MFARKMKLKLKGLEVGTTPMLVPSFSSKANIDIIKTLETMSETINGPVLISAYDVYYAKNKNNNFPEITFPDLIFLDSGGYECLKDKDASEIGFYNPEPRKWDREMHFKIVQTWPKDIPTVVISYDHPSLRESTEKQIENSKNFFRGIDNVLKEILIKPETKGAIRINPDNIIQNLDLLSTFDILGFTEKELGYSIFDRMITIAKIRIEMERRDIRIPIHIFGSLDTITTPLYYFSGADIFDGLTWIRFSFNNGETLYSNSFLPKQHGIQSNMNVLHITNLNLNYNYILRLKMDLEKYQSTDSFVHFGQNSDFFKKAFEDLNVKIKEVN